MPPSDRRRDNGRNGRMPARRDARARGCDERCRPVLSLGLGGSNHDFSACLVDGGDIVAGIEEERIRRVKYSVGVNSMFNESWRYCLDAHAVTLDDVDAIVAD